MFRHSPYFRFLFAILILASAGALSHSDAIAQSTLKKVRLGIAATSVGFLPIYAAYHRGFYRDEGIDLEIILMSLAAANNAFFKDVFVAPMGGSGPGRLAVLESGVVDASLLSVPENIIALQKGYNELIFLGDIVTFPQNGFGTSVTRIQQQPDEVYRMVRATLRGLAFISDDGAKGVSLRALSRKRRCAEGHWRKI